jgi:integral membrane protein (TIGR00529 family)
MTSIPAVVLILAVFISMLALTRFKVPLGIALSLGGIALGLLAHMPIMEIGRTLALTFVRPDLWLLMVVIVLISEIARFMTRNGNAQRIVAVISRWGGRHGRAWSLMAAPAIIGLLPMPGGALFSAPLVQQAACDHEAETEGPYPAEWKTALNYWFRHIWEFWWPLYPGVIFAVSIFDIEPLKFIAALIIFTPVSALAGYISLVRPYLKRLEIPDSADKGESDNRALLLLTPLVIVVVAAMFLPSVLASTIPALDSRSCKLLAMLLGLLIALALTRYFERDQPGRLSIRAMFDKKTRGILLTIVGVFVFQNMLQGAALVETACIEMAEWGIPAAVAVAALPALAGLVTGVAAAFAAVSLPLVVQLLATPEAGLHPMATIILAYVSGYVGMMMSPVHLCIIVTGDYFSASLRNALLRIVPCALVVFSFAVILFSILNALGI